ncbi:hypothetical protein [Sphingosinicella sp. LY1275]|uniref:hypothetical protein n=1 Tax=Sphingosinicella sp. LY1275 TaxID=3095379 RepID=UPI002ADEA8B5|nr:hypothetical protein [Sphingosinicella sp. LY1275]MEA1014163.1 hypothetical protein [Sphingosinicella sp. LY1275]
MSQSDHLAPSLKAAIAEEIRDLRRLVEQLAEILVADEQFAMTYTEQLQTFDLVIQRADESADLLERLANGLHSLEAVEGVRLGVVQDRLRAALRAA